MRARCVGHLSWSLPRGSACDYLPPTLRWFLLRFARTLLSLGVEHPHWSSDTHSTSARTPSFLGIHVWDVEGKQYIDCLSAYSAVNQVSIRLAHAWPP